MREARSNSSIVGFSLFRNLAPARADAALVAQRRALRHFPVLVSDALTIGDTTLTYWGHGDLTQRICREPDGTTSILVGSPHDDVDWVRAAPALFSSEGEMAVTLPWDGRTVVLRIAAAGREWDMWTDWVGSIPVFYTRRDDAWIASTLEPVVVAAGGFTSADISLPALLSELINGHFLDESTLFAGMRAVPADAHARWRGGAVECRRLWSVTPTRERWETEWDDLVDEMHALVSEVIRLALGRHPAWTILLSSGLDSRLIAAVGTQLGADLRAYTWGEAGSTDVVCGRRVAGRLGLPWRHIDIGRDYLVNRVEPWTDVFGSSLHVHGMYQMEFFSQLRNLPGGPVVSGFLGDALGAAHGAAVTPPREGRMCALLADGYLHWDAAEVAGLLKVPPGEAMVAVEQEIADTLKALPGAPFQKSILLEIWTRQRRFTGFSPMLADYEQGVATPYLSRAYARFCLSLPRAALARQLIEEVLRRYHPRLAEVPGSYRPEPHRLTGRYLLKRRLAGWLPFIFPRGYFEYIPLAMDLECVRAHGWRALSPIPETWDTLGRWVDLKKVSHVLDAIVAGSQEIRDVRRLQSVQCLAHRLQGASVSPTGPR